MRILEEKEQYVNEIITMLPIILDSRYKIGIIYPEKRVGMVRVSVLHFIFPTLEDISALEVQCNYK